MATCWLALGTSALGCATNLQWPSAVWPAASAQAFELREDPPADLAAPEGMRAVSGQLRSVPLKWEPLLVGDVGGYVIERADQREGTYERIARIPGDLMTTYVDRDTLPGNPAVSAEPANEVETPVLDGLTWFYRVRAYSPAGLLSADASETAAATTAGPPQAPEDLRAYSRQPRRVPLSWRPPEDPNVIGYRVERSPTSRGPFELLTEIDGSYQTAHVDRGLGDLRVFYYRVAAVNSAGGVGEPTDVVRAVTKPEPLPPVGLRATERRLGVNRLEWDPNVEEDIVNYRLLRSREGDDSPELVALLDSAQTSAEDEAVGADEPVSYTVIALDRDGLESDPAELVEVASEGYELSATVRPDGVHLQWNPRHAEGFYRGQVFREGLIQQNALGESLDGTFVDAEVKAGSSYRYVVGMERADQTLGPRSTPVQISIPRTWPD
jgi:fibronectin type 3 domain-containing protein